MEVVATISTRLFCLSVELRRRTNDDDDSSIPASSAWWWWVAPLLPALLASLLHATVVRPLAAATRHCLSHKLQDTCTWSTSTTWLRVLSKVTNCILRILLSEQTSLWLLYLMAPQLFDINVKLRVEVATIRAMINNTAGLLLRLVTGLRVSVSAASASDADTAAATAAATDAATDGPGVREREDGPRRSARHRRPSVRVAGPEWDTST